MIFNSPIATVETKRVKNNQVTEQTDCLAVEEPLEIRLDAAAPAVGLSESGRIQKSISITMRTPGNDAELGLGFLLTEGVLDPTLSADSQVVSVQHCGPAQPHLGHSNIIKISLSQSTQVNWKSMERNFYTTSSCGVCGKASIEALRLKSATELIALQKTHPLQIDKNIIPLLPDRLREAQDIFRSTGGLHASGLFDAHGKLLILREDVGRHNALDKVIGWAFQKQLLPLSDSILVLSGRISFELVQKAAMAGIPIIVAVGAPSSLALQLAIEARITLVGFVKSDQFNIYHDESRLL